MNTLEVYDMAIDIERRLSNMYHRFSTLFKENSEIHNFWSGVANHEKSHSEMLTLSKGYLLWNHPSLEHEKDALINKSCVKELELLETILKEYERKIKRERISLQEALEILLTIENSELNQLYNRLINLSGFRPSQKPENMYCFIYEHMKVIKLFMDKHYRGNLPTIRVEEYKKTNALPLETAPGRVRGKIAEVIPEMSYGFIEGEDARRYMFLPEDISEGKWEDAEIGRDVEFSVIGLPWGPRANNVKIRH